MFTRFPGRLAAATLTVFAAVAAHAGELPAAQLATIKQKLARIQGFPAIDSAQTTGMNGLIEVRAGTNIFYTDANGDFLIEGHLTDTKTGKDLTEARLEDINRIDFNNLPVRDAVVWKTGTGKRRLAVFADPNCGYCKRLEKDIQQLKDVTVYTYMVAILGDDSKVKLDNIWCVQDRTQAWRDWMLAGVQPARAFGACASPAQRNGALAQRLGIHGTPAIFFEDGTRIGGAAAAPAIEQRLAKASAAKQGD
ncbi:MAG: DsbC family protein [Burkholderiales bacterium]|nr:DsbC family protein [Burkholderiales bacterium]